MRIIYRAAIFTIFILMFSSAVKSQVKNGQKTDLTILAGNKITGAWRINYAESDNPILKMQAMLQNKMAQSADEKNSESDAIPAMSVSLVPPETLIIAGEDNGSITINEGFDEIVFTRTVATDGKTRIGAIQDGANFSITAEQKDNLLKVEMRSPRGNKMTETYGFVGEGRKLIVTVRFEDAQAKEILSLRRVYDRTVSGIFSPDSTQFQ